MLSCVSLIGDSFKYQTITIEEHSLSNHWRYQAKQDITVHQQWRKKGSRQRAAEAKVFPTVWMKTHAPIWFTMRSHGMLRDFFFLCSCPVTECACICVECDNRRQRFDSGLLWKEPVQFKALELAVTTVCEGMTYHVKKDQQSLWKSCTMSISKT